MILLTGFYEDADTRRRNEVLECLRRNLENDWLDEIHLFVEDSLEIDKLVAAYPSLAAAKIRLIAQGRRVMYRELFAHANASLPGQCVIIANADIFFDHTLATLNGYDLSDKLLCLSRWDVQPDGSARFFDYPASQDAWIFQATIRNFPCDFHLGVLGCDNRLAWEAEHAGLILSNPSRSLRVYHLHLSGVRRYSECERLSGPTRAVPACFLNTPRCAPSLSCASVAFCETMGYTLARFEIGVSSHNNDPRPFTAIPEPLAGLEFTQVVASSVSPVEVEFLTAGKLYVLVGNDWEGYYPATSWLSEQGFRENLPLVQTRRGTAFEAWSIIGEVGERFVLPTQMMLVADHLVEKDRQQDSQEKDGIYLNTSRLVNPVGRERVVLPPTRHLLIATRHGCGLWSMFFEVIGLIRYAECHNLEPVVYFNDATCWWSQVGHNGSRNAWEYFFEPIGQASVTELLGTNGSSLEHASVEEIQAVLPHDLVMSDYVLDHVGHYDHTEAQRQEYASIVRRRIRVKSQVLARLDQALVEALTGGASAVHYRGTDKFCESPRQSVHEYYDAIQHRVDPSHKLFVATDDVSFLEWMIGTYGKRVLYTQAARSHNQTALHFGSHRGAPQAEECLLDVLLMAKCQHLVHGNSSVTNGVLVFNPTMSHDALHRQPGSEKPA